jgi:antitoxin (DNA-binding transcriptional repressor) of toxin-antitoxin stability system
MNRVGIRELKARPSAYVRRATAGERLYVTDHGRIVAELGPPDSAATGGSAARRFERAVASGRVTPAQRSGDKLWLARPRVAAPSGTAAELLDAERDEP